MRLPRPALLALACLLAGPGLARADATPPAARGPVGIAIEDFTYVDTSGEPTDQSAAHQRRLAALMAALRRDLAADPQHRLVPLPCGEACAQQPADDLLRAAADAGAQILIIGGVHKLSTLVQWAKVEAIDVAGNRVVLDRLFTFRGDTDEAWSRAEAFISEEIRAALATQ